mmetsp:Transcript_19118/g.44059  ORF Transcript_19118/g.44059 Transcript_19118/m.44059 type:complete len:267 (+) Transcript_19118:384-1184(+)
MALFASSERRLQATSRVSREVFEEDRASAIASPPLSDTSLPLRRSCRSHTLPRSAEASPSSVPGPMWLPLRLRKRRRSGRPPSGERRAVRCSWRSPSLGPAPRPLTDKSRAVREAQSAMEVNIRRWSSAFPSPIILLPRPSVPSPAAAPDTAAAPAAPVLQLLTLRDSRVVLCESPFARNWAPTTPIGLVLRLRVFRSAFEDRTSAISIVEMKDKPMLDASSSVRAVLSRRKRARIDPPASSTRQFATFSTLKRSIMPAPLVRQCS